MFLAPPEAHARLRQALGGLKQVTFGFDRAGTQVVYYQPNPPSEP
jgi:D-glycero-alpha-D-manno-heptose-7-phosphate kinase